MIASMSEDQLNEVLNTLLVAARAPIQPAAPAAPVVPARSAEEIRAERRELMDVNSDKFDPEAAVRSVVNDNYGPLIRDISRRANEGQKMALRNMLPDFEKHEADINKVLENVAPENINENMLTQTYFAVVGAKTAAQQMRDRATPPSTRQPSNAPVKGEEQPLSQEEIDVAKVQFRNSADPVAEYRKAQKMVEEGGFTVKTPESR